MPEIEALLILIAVLCFGIFVQSAAGFAAGLLIIPALMWAGFGIPEAQASLLVATIPQNLWGVQKFREHVEPQVLWLPASLRLSFLPIGMAALTMLESLPPTTLRQCVGGILLIVTLAIMFFRPHPRVSLPKFWTFTAFSASGFLQGLVGMGGPAMVLWVQAHDWDTRKTRGFLFSMYLISLAPAFGCLAWVFGSRVLVPAMTTAALTPLLLLMTAWGLRFGTWLGRKQLRRLTFALLIAMALTGLAAPWLTRS